MFTLADFKKDYQQIKADFLQGMISGVSVSLISTSLIIILFSQYVFHLPHELSRIFISIMTSCILMGYYSKEKIIFSDLSIIATLILASLGNKIFGNSLIATEDYFFYFIGSINLSCFVAGVALYLLVKYKLTFLVRYLPRTIFNPALSVVLLGSFSCIFQLSNIYYNTTYIDEPEMLQMNLRISLITLLLGVFLGSYLVYMELNAKKFEQQLEIIFLTVVVFFCIAFSLGLSFQDIKDYYNIFFSFNNNPGSFLSVFEFFNVNKTFIQNLQYIIGEFDFQLTLSVLYSLLFVISGAVFSRLLEVTSMEVEMNKEIDADNELLGIAKTYLFSSLIGAGFITRYAGADIAAATKNGTQSKFFSIMGFCLPLLLCTVSPYFYLFIPKFVILAIFVKVLFLTTWRILLLPLLTLHLKEKIIMLIGMVFVLNTGLMPGTFYTGILHFVIFAIEYMRCKIVKAKFSLDMIQSNTQRDLIDNMLLGTYGHKTIVWLLQGYVFFGNAYNLKMQLLKLIKDRIAENNPIDAVVIDFKAVQGTDTDIIYNIKTIYQVLNRFNVILCVCYPNLEKNALNEKNLHIFNYLDECLLWNENRIIAAFTSADHAKANPLDKILPNKEDQEILKEFADIRTLNPYNMLYLEKSTIQSIFFLMEGEVNLMFTGDISSGGQLFSQIVLAGNFVGEGEVFLDAVARSTAITKSKSVILELRMDRLAEIQQRHPHLVNILYRYILSDCFYRMDRSKSLSSEILGFSNNA